MASYSKTHWWSRWEVQHQVLQQFGDVESFLREHDISPATHTKLLDSLSDPQQFAMLKDKLAAVVDIGSYFCESYI